MEIINKYMVGADMDGNICVTNGAVVMSRWDALQFAAWIVALADPRDELFNEILTQVKEAS